MDSKSLGVYIHADEVRLFEPFSTDETIHIITSGDIGLNNSLSKTEERKDTEAITAIKRKNNTQEFTAEISNFYNQIRQYLESYNRILILGSGHHLNNIKKLLKDELIFMAKDISWVNYGPLSDKEFKKTVNEHFLKK